MIECKLTVFDRVSDLLRPCEIASTDIIYEAREQGKLLGAGLFFARGEVVTIKKLVGDNAVKELLLRSILFYAERHGCVYFSLSKTVFVGSEFPLVAGYFVDEQYRIDAFFIEKKNCES